jgi:hypothetical protein
MKPWMKTGIKGLGIGAGVVALLAFLLTVYSLVRANGEAETYLPRLHKRADRFMEDYLSDSGLGCSSNVFSDKFKSSCNDTVLSEVRIAIRHKLKNRGSTTVLPGSLHFTKGLGYPASWSLSFSLRAPYDADPEAKENFTFVKERGGNFKIQKFEVRSLRLLDTGDL